MPSLAASPQREPSAISSLAVISHKQEKNNPQAINIGIWAVTERGRETNERVVRYRSEAEVGEVSAGRHEDIAAHSVHAAHVAHLHKLHLIVVLQFFHSLLFVFILLVVFLLLSRVAEAG
jgi:hypothetical protein